MIAFAPRVPRHKYMELMQDQAVFSMGLNLR